MIVLDEKRPGILRKLEELKRDKWVFILKSPREVANFIETLEQ